MSGIKTLILADTKGMVQPTNEMIREESMESQTSREEVAEKKSGK